MEQFITEVASVPGRPVQCAVQGGVATIMLHNPPLNVVTRPLVLALGETLDALERDEAVRAVVVTGSGDRAFSAGSDITEFSHNLEPGEIISGKLGRQNEIFSRLDAFPKPTVAAISGLAFGGGLEIAVCCDILVVEERTRLALPEIKLGVFPGSAGTIRVTRRIGEGRAKEMMFLGDPIDAQTALAWGLVNRVVPNGESLETARAIAATLAERPRLALEHCKRIIDLSLEMPQEDAIQRSMQASDVVFRSAEKREGVAAFLGKRRADFSKT
ncbi:enoyl-CoA hydratase/isomerase family protein [Roseomonas gilardii]|uniref:enoyl-CoA hydratase/isomerase family protein n=1 Tax=Roseomonas gilardii TaxID=257708 RepID=UPI0004AD77E7|nr:enoyl-CoA hydratase-related protein [Roseomonas gilardii]